MKCENSPRSPQITNNEAGTRQRACEMRTTASKWTLEVNRASSTTDVWRPILTIHFQKKTLSWLHIPMVEVHINTSIALVFDSLRCISIPLWCCSGPCFLKHLSAGYCLRNFREGWGEMEQSSLIGWEAGNSDILQSLNQRASQHEAQCHRKQRGLKCFILFQQDRIAVTTGISLWRIASVISVPFLFLQGEE